MLLLFPAFEQKKHFVSDSLQRQNCVVCDACLHPLFRATLHSFVGNSTSSNKNSASSRNTQLKMLLHLSHFFFFLCLNGGNILLVTVFEDRIVLFVMLTFIHCFLQHFIHLLATAQAPTRIALPPGTHD